MADSPTWDEVGHFAAGLSHWKHGNFSCYRVNPPLVRLIATAPLALVGPEISLGYDELGADNWVRPEFAMGRHIAQAEGARFFDLISACRLVLIPLSALGAALCAIWATQLYGRRAGLVAAFLWSFSPSFLAHGHLITPDVAASSLGLLASFAFWKWLQRPSGWMALSSGFALGTAALAKATWLILFGLWPAFWLLLIIGVRRHAASRLALSGQVAMILIIGAFVINAGYGFERSFVPLGNYHFRSQLLGGFAEPREELARHNRFIGTVWENVPSFLPANYLLGIDLQAAEFGERQWSYLNGEWRFGGWWYYYIYALLVKEPISIWVLAIPAIFAAWRYWRSSGFFLFVHALAVIFIVSEQTGFNHHMRYVLPALPYVFVLIASLAAEPVFGRIKWGVVALVGWYTVSSLSVYPHSLSYFNELAGGPVSGPNHLANSNADWGQDLLWLRDWMGAHPSVRPLHLAYDLPLIDPKAAGIEYLPVPLDPRCPKSAGMSERQVGPVPGWHAIGVNLLHARQKDYDYFLLLKPAAMVGYSIYIYHLSPEEANTLRANLGLQSLPASDTGGEP